MMRREQSLFSYLELNTMTSLLLLLNFLPSELMISCWYATVKNIVSDPLSTHKQHVGSCWRCDNVLNIVSIVLASLLVIDTFHFQHLTDIDMIFNFN